MTLSPDGEVYLRPRSSPLGGTMWSLLYFMFTACLYFLGFVSILLLAVTCPIWIGPLALVLGVGWGIDQVKALWS